MKTKASLLSKSLMGMVALMAALVTGSGTAMADELTVTSSTSKTYTANVPIAGNLLGSTLVKCEYIIPASKITALQGKQLTKMSLTLNAATTGWGEAEFQVFLKEVTATAFPSPVALIGTDGATVVYEGQLDATKTSIDIDFTTPFGYSSDNTNLLVGLYCTKTGTDAAVNFKLIRESTSDYNYYSAYTSSANGSLTRTNWYPETTITYQATEVATPVISVSPATIAFGSLRASATQTVTVRNTGVGSMDVTIASDNTTDFTLSATELTGIGAGESKTFDVTFNYDAASLGDKSGSITVTPSYNADDVKTISVTATAANANVWEDFDSGIPSTWYNENGSWLNYVTGLSGYASPGYNSSHVLRTPRLYAEAGQQLGFDVKIAGKYSSNVVKSRYSTDRVTWSDEVTYSTDGTYTIEAPATGYYWVEFTASQAGIDNMTGWTVAEAIHDTKLGTVTIPAKGTAHGTYTASVVVKELGGSDETVTAALYFGDEKVAEQQNVAVGGNRDVTIALSYLPTEEFSGNVSIKVTGANIGTLSADPVAVEITETSYVFDEDSDENPVVSTSSVVKVKFTARKGWNTIVMPFSLSGSAAYMNTLFGEDWKAYTISGCDEGTISFTSVTYLPTTTPLLVYAPNAESHPDGVYLQNVSAGSYNWSHSNINKTAGDVTFKGTFQPIDAPGLAGKYGITTLGTVTRSGTGTSVKAYHAYLELAEGAESRTLVIAVDGEVIADVTTDIGGMVSALGGSEPQPAYNLNGQRVRKAGKGLYIVGGRKVVVR